MARPDRPSPRRAVLLRRQDRPLPGDRHRRPDRRLAGHARARRRGRDHRRDARASLEPRRRRRDRGARLADARPATGTPPDRASAKRCPERPRSGPAPRVAVVAMTDEQRQLPAPPEHRAHLPAVEPERQITDWGRSERVESVMDKTLYDFLYHYWFRVSVEGIEHVPSTGGALLVSNHA